MMDYSGLKVAIANWLHRTDSITVIPDFIRFAESRINRELATRINDVDLPLTLNSGSRFIPLPADYVAPYALYLTTITPREKLRFKDVLELKLGSSAGWPDCWTINGSNIELEMPADITHSFLFKYRKGFVLSDANPTNWLLDNHPDLYLYGSLIESASYIKDDERLALWQNRYDLALVQVQNKEMASQALATLGSEITGLVSPEKPDIYTDD